MLDRAPIMAFVPTMDLDGARAYYEGILGLTVTEQTEFAIALRGGGCAVRVTKVESFTPQPFTVLGWIVDDITETVDQLRERGVEFTVFESFGQDEHGIWTAPDGVRIAWFRDPDGNTLSLTQF